VGKFKKHGPCAACDSRDNRATYEDGSSYCFGCEKWEPGPNGGKKPQNFDPKSEKPIQVNPFPKVEVLRNGEFQAIENRGITEETCRKFGYTVGVYQGKHAHFAEYYNERGDHVASHVRLKDKSFPWIGDHDRALPFGATRFQRSGRMVTVCEGEIDAMSLSQVQVARCLNW
jgi:twinkle protein